MKDKVILRLTENVTVKGNGGREVKIVARIDTGATSSSIDESLAGELQLGPVLRSKVIKSASGIRKRPAVKIAVIIKDICIEEEFTLADRSHMTYKMLIGQNVLNKGNFLIDPSKNAETEDK